MNSRISVDLHENIVIKTDTCPTADELLTAVCDYPFLINVIVEQTLPKLRKYAEDNERSHNLDRSFRNIYIVPSFPTREQHAHSVQNARSRFNKLNQSYSC